MKLKIGLVGLPNVGKSTLFNAITNAGVAAENYPFCTIEPNIGTVEVPDERLITLSGITGSVKTIHATIEFVDIAGLVKGASKGEGLGNQFLTNIRETSAIAHVVRCFENDDIIHVNGKIDPISDIEIIHLELLYADLDLIDKLVHAQSKKIKSQKKDEVKKYNVYTKIQTHLAKNIPVRQIELDEEETLIIKGLNFLTQKKVIFVLNIDDSQIDTPSTHISDVIEYAKKTGDIALPICVKLEEELSELDDDEKKDFLTELNLESAGLDKLANAGFSLLGLETYLTSGEKETRAWTIPVNCKAPQAAGVIHTDFEKGFIRANIVSFENFELNKGWKGCKEKGLVRQEGKDYVMEDGDVVEFLFNN
ncbi:redox-regulated ATPase YchF [bacterium]|nr:redox-regulated ATPase YchF [bacterium]